MTDREKERQRKVKVGNRVFISTLFIGFILLLTLMARYRSKNDDFLNLLVFFELLILIIGIIASRRTNGY